MGNQFINAILRQLGRDAAKTVFKTVTADSQRRGSLVSSRSKLPYLVIVVVFIIILSLI